MLVGELRLTFTAARRSLDILKAWRVIQVQLVPHRLGTAKQNHERHLNYGTTRKLRPSVRMSSQIWTGKNALKVLQRSTQDKDRSISFLKVRWRVEAGGAVIGDGCYGMLSNLSKESLQKYRPNTDSGWFRE